MMALDTAGRLARMVKIEHSVFALPFAYAGMFLAQRGSGWHWPQAFAPVGMWPGWGIFLLLTVAMVAVRSFAMTANRLADLDIDRVNPRTAGRELVTGAVTTAQARVFLAVTGLVFVLCCYGLNELCFMLSPLALFVSAFYSLCKRFTWTCHFVLGLVIGLAPLAGWLAVEPVFRLPAFLLLCGVALWVAGFDILYAAQDAGFDREMGLHSIPARFGLPTAFALAAFSHAMAALFLLLAGAAWGLAWPFYAVWAVVGGVLAWEHSLIGPDDLSRLNMAFFTLNGVVAVVFLGGVVWGLAA